MKRKQIQYLWNLIRFWHYTLPRCHICGYPLSLGRPWTYSQESGEITPSYFYECNCFTKNAKK